MTKNILVTGGAGYIGSHTCKELSKSGYQPIVFDNLVYGHRQAVQWGPLIEGDLANIEHLNKVFSDFKPVAVIHFAAYAYVGESVQDPQKYYHNNVTGTLQLLAAMLANGCKKLVFSSTCATYGTPEIVPIPENHKQAPINPYGKSKLMIEQILQDYDAAYGLRSAALRYFNAAGADPEGELGEKHDPETHLIPLTLDVALGKSERIRIFGDDYPTRDGTCIRDYIHVLDLARAHVLALDHLLENGQSLRLNLGTGKGFTVEEVVSTIEKTTGKPIRRQIVERRAGDPPALVACADQAHSVLGWQPKSSDLATIVQTAWAWHRAPQF